MCRQGHHCCKWNSQLLPLLHRYDKFSYDITGALAKAGRSGVHELIVRVFDPTEFAHIPLGKQRLHAPGTNTIFYTGSSGIWQTVWLEPVRATAIIWQTNAMHLEPSCTATPAALLLLLVLRRLCHSSV